MFSLLFKILIFILLYKVIKTLLSGFHVVKQFKQAGSTNLNRDSDQSDNFSAPRKSSKSDIVDAEYKVID